jgi:DNA-binding transcriptional LysR family regulator
MARRANLSGGGRDQDCLGPFHLAATPAIGPDDLRDEPLVMFPRHADQSLYDRLLTIFKAGGYRVRRIKHAIGSRRRDLLVAVAQGEGVALIPTSAEDLVDSSTVLVPRPLTRALFMPDTVVVWRVAAPERLAESLASIRVLASTLYSA